MGLTEPPPYPIKAKESENRSDTKQDSVLFAPSLNPTNHIPAEA
jgi:hypothetical protein